MAFLALFKKNTIKKPEIIFHIRLRAQEVIRGHVHGTETNLAMPLKPQDSFFDNEAIFVFITSVNHLNFKITH